MLLANLTLMQATFRELKDKESQSSTSIRRSTSEEVELIPSVAAVSIATNVALDGPYIVRGITNKKQILSWMVVIGIKLEKSLRCKGFGIFNSIKFGGEVPPEFAQFSA